MTWSPLLAAIVSLSLAAWAAFYLVGSPLNAAETAVVVGLCGVFAYLVRAAIRTFRKGPGDARPER